MASIAVPDELMEQLKRMAHEAGEPVDAVVESLLRDIVDVFCDRGSGQLLRKSLGTPAPTPERINQFRDDNTGE